MNAQELQTYFGAAAFIVAFVVGLDSSLWLTRRYNKAKVRIAPPYRGILGSIVIACWLITATSGWIGVLSVIRLLWEMTFSWTPPITLGLATAIVFIPLMFRLAIGRVVRENAKDDPSTRPPSNQ